MLSWIMLGWANMLIDFVPGGEDSIVSAISFYFFAFFIPLLYAIIGIKKFMGIRWYWAIAAGLGVMVAVNLANMFYRFIIFIETFWVT